MPSLRIVFGQSVASGTSIDLLANTDGFRLRLDGWVPQIATRSGSLYQDVVETITLRAIGSSRDNLSTIITDYLDKILYRVQDGIENAISPNLVFLVWSWSQVSGSTTHERSALIKDISYTINSTPYFPPVNPQSQILNLTITILRSPYWEGTSVYRTYANSILTGGDNKVAGFEIEKGSAPGRVGFMQVEGSSLREYWTGFRTDKYGNKDLFVPVWPFDSVTTSNDATESGGTVTWNSADSSLLERLRIKMTQVSNIISRASQRGVFTVLLRARSTGTETFNVRLSDGFVYGGNWNTHSRVKISGTSFLFYSLGTISIPPLGFRQSGLISTILEDYALRLEAEVNTSGTGNFEATRFVLIPQDEGYLHIKGVNTSGLAWAHVINEVDDKWIAYTYYPSLQFTETPTEFDVINYYIPFDAFNIIFAGQGSSQSTDSTSTVKWNVSYVPRYLGIGEKRG